jgi:zinc-ribbon domain
MFCPNCGQQQSSDEMRFCSRCGFQLGSVRELIAEAVAQVQREPERHERLTKVFKAMRRSAWTMLLGILLSFLTGLMTALDEDLAPLLLLPSVCFVVGFVFLLYGAFVKGRGITKEELKAASQPALIPIATVRRSELPPSRVMPVANAPSQWQTAEINQPPSVTENTTRFLDEEQKNS